MAARKPGPIAKVVAARRAVIEAAIANATKGRARIQPVPAVVKPRYDAAVAKAKAAISESKSKSSSTSAPKVRIVPVGPKPSVRPKGPVRPASSKSK